MRKTLHPVPGMEHNENWKIQENWTSSGTRFVPKLGGRPLMKMDGKSATVAWYSTLDEASDSVREFLSRMA